nr:MAG TPA: hypothetical protein [Caudoviricetes sp.]
MLSSAEARYKYGAVDQGLRLHSRTTAGRRATKK